MKFLIEGNNREKGLNASKGKREVSSTEFRSLL